MPYRRLTENDPKHSGRARKAAPNLDRLDLRQDLNPANPSYPPEEAWDAFDLDDQAPEPEPEHGDFWIEPPDDDACGSVFPG